MSKKSFQLVVKILIVAALFYFLFSKGFISLKDTKKALSDWGNLGPALAALSISALLGVIRWQWLLKAQGTHLSFFRVAQLSFIGSFFNIALPGAVSGDFVKAFYVGREIQGQRARAFGSILFDRVAGLCALILLSGCSLLIARSMLPKGLFVAVEYSILLGVIAVICGISYLFLVRPHHDVVLILIKRLEAFHPKMAAITRIYEGLRHYHSHRITVLKVLAISILIHMLVGFMCVKFANALGVQDIPLIAVYVLVPLGLLVTAIPVLPAGLGTGHAAFLYLFGLIGVQRGADIFTLYALAQMLIGGVGGLIYLQFRGHEPKIVFETARS